MKKIKFIYRFCSIVEKAIVLIVPISSILWIGGLILLFINKDISKAVLLSFVVIYGIALLLALLWGYLNKQDKSSRRDFILSKFCDLIKEEGVHGTVQILIKNNYWFHLKFYTSDVKKINYNKFIEEMEETLDNINNPRFILQCQEIDTTLSQSY